MKIDHRKDTKEVEVHLDLDFPNFPCHLLGLDLVDYVGTHYPDVGGKLKKYNLDSKGFVLGEHSEESLVRVFF